jgi:hypothetical protein
MNHHDKQYLITVFFEFKQAICFIRVIKSLMDLLSGSRYWNWIRWYFREFYSIFR